MLGSDALVAHYHEIGLKGRNRDFFEDALAVNMRRALRGTGYRKLRRGFGRLYADFYPESFLQEAIERASRVFGVVYTGLGRFCAPDIDDIVRTALEIMSEELFESFRVRARRTHSSFELRSQQINEIVGLAIKNSTGARVDLKGAGATCWIELFGSHCVVYRKRRAGPGGLPSGTSGRVLALLSGGIDSPVAAWRMARRGAEVEAVHFHGQPYTDPSSVRQARDIAEVLARYSLKVVLHLVPLGDAQREIVVNAPSELRTLLYRRAMLRIAEHLAHERDARALITGDSLGQVASQTLTNIATVDAAAPRIQVLRPLIGMDKQEIIDDAQRIGTYEISTRRYQDCCVLFEPRSPVTRSQPRDAERAEEGLDMNALVGKALAGLETVTVELPDVPRPQHSA